MTSARQPSQVPGWLDSIEPRTSRPSGNSSTSADPPRAADDGLPVQHGVVGRLVLRLRTDSLVRNSLYLLFSTGLRAVFSLVFWIIAARSFSTAETGAASSLLSATAFIALLALLGLDTSFIRYLPGAKNRDSLITGGLTVAMICGLVLAALYVLAVPTIAPHLEFIDRSLPLAIGVIVVTSTASVNGLTDSIFIGSHKSGYIALTDGAIAGVVKIGALLFFVGSGAFGLYTASSAGLVATTLASIVLIATPLGWRPRFRDSLNALRPLARFSGANYATELLAIIPQTVLPIIMLDRLGPSDAAYYFVAYQVAGLTYATIFAVQSTMLAEGGRTHTNLRSLVRRSTRLILMVSLPVVLVVALGSHWILLVFGAKYSAHGTPALLVLMVTTLPMAAYSIIYSVIRLVGRLRVLVTSSVLFAGALCGLAWLLAPRGLVAATAAWPLSIALATLPGGASLLFWRPSSARHRRTDLIHTRPDHALAPTAGVRPDRDFAEVQQAGLTVLLGLSMAGNTAPIAFRLGDFDLSAPSRREGENFSGRGRTRQPPRHSSGMYASAQRSQHSVHPDTQRRSSSSR